MKKIFRYSQSQLFIGIAELLFIIVILQSCIISKSTRKSDDGSTSLSHSDSLLIRPFSLTDYPVKHTFLSPSEINFQIIEAANLLEILPYTGHTWITIGASWCPISQQALSKFTGIVKEFNGDSIRWLFISQDLNVSKLQQELYDAQVAHISYLLDPKKYGTDEVYKQEKFAKDISEELPIQAFKGGGVPISLIINKKFQVEYLFRGIKVNKDSIAKYTSLKLIKTLNEF